LKIGKKLIYILYFALIINLSNCRNFEREKNDDLNHLFELFYNREFKIDVFYIKNNSVTRFIDKPFLIISSIDGDCSCSVEQLEKWQNLKNFIGSYYDNVEIIIYLSSEYDFLVYEELFKEIAPGLCLVFDKENLYLSNNDLHLVPDNFRTFLLDSTNSVKIIGNPINNPKVYEIYTSYFINFE